MYTCTQKSELDIYLEEATEEDGDDFDVLAWWKRHAEKFPILSAMARGFLTIPLSTVASESAFSCGGRILGDTRSSLSPRCWRLLFAQKIDCISLGTSVMKVSKKLFSERDVTPSLVHSLTVMEDSSKSCPTDTLLVLIHIILDEEMKKFIKFKNSATFLEEWITKLVKKCFS